MPMRLEPPSWWYGGSGQDRLKASLLAPLGMLYGTGIRARFALTKPYRSTLPVICIGNFTLGGAGKTPLALAIAEIICEIGLSPAFLTRGYGGRIAGPHLVDIAQDNAANVGDEALLLARAAPTMVARARPDGAKAIEQLGASVIIMDDGFQNPSLVKDLSLIAIDAASGIGNGRVFPTGPLRAPLTFQAKRADSIILIGEGDDEERNYAGTGLPVLRATLNPASDHKWLHAQPVIAFCGIGRPEKFFTTLRQSGAELAAMRAFPDHHVFTKADARALLDQTCDLGAQLVTTEKDYVRLDASAGALAKLKSTARTLPVKLFFSPAAQDALVTQLKKNCIQ